MSLVLPFVDIFLSNSYICYVFLIGFIAFLIYTLFRR